MLTATGGGRFERVTVVLVRSASRFWGATRIWWKGRTIYEAGPSLYEACLYHQECCKTKDSQQVQASCQEPNSLDGRFNNDRAI
jgi:hypothetical protein